MAIRTVTGFLGALTTIVVVLAVVAVVERRIEQRPDIDLDGQWRLAHTIEKGPYKTWTFEYDLTLAERDGGFVGQGETVAVNGRPPEPHEQTTLDIVRGMVEGRSLIAWFFERNGERAGRGAIKWQVLDPDRLVGTYATTFSAGSSVALRASDAPSQPTAGLR